MSGSRTISTPPGRRQPDDRCAARRTWTAFGKRKDARRTSPRVAPRIVVLGLGPLLIDVDRLRLDVLHDAVGVSVWPLATTSPVDPVDDRGIATPVRRPWSCRVAHPVDDGRSPRRPRAQPRARRPSGPCRRASNRAVDERDQPAVRERLHTRASGPPSPSKGLLPSRCDHPRPCDPFLINTEFISMWGPLPWLGRP